jgi:hypothetical protein
MDYMKNAAGDSIDKKIRAIASESLARTVSRPRGSLFWDAKAITL